MDKTESLTNLEPKSSQRQFFQWAVKWFYANVPEDTSTKPDIPSIICLLQAVGFKLRKFEKQHQSILTEKELKNESVRITMECGASKMIAVLDTDDVICECIDNVDPKDGSFWSVSGTGPAGSMNNLNKIDETGSDMLPEMSKDLTVVIRDITSRLFKMINKKGDINQNMEADINLSASFKNNSIIKPTKNITEGLVRSYTDTFHGNYKVPKPAPRKNTASSKECNEKPTKSQINREEPQIKREGTYDIDEILEEPRTSPQKLPISPVSPELCTSLAHISLQSDDEIVGLADYVVKAHQILDKAVNFIIKKIPLNSSPSSILDDSIMPKRKPGPLRSSSFCTSPRSVASTGNNSIANQSMSSIASSRMGSISSMPARPSIGQLNRALPMGPKSALRTGMTTTPMPLMRGRSSSLGVSQKPSLKTPGIGNAPQARRKNSANGNGTSTGTMSAQRSVPGVPKLQNKSGSFVMGRTVTKHRNSPEIRSTNSTPNGPRANVSLLKAPSISSRHSTGSTTSTTKFNYSNFKK